MGSRACCVLLGAALAACAHAPGVLRSKPTILGGVTFDETGVARVHECGGTKRTLRVGSMADETSYTHLRWRYDDISRNGQDPVLIELAAFEQASDQGVTLEEAEVLKIKPGLCDVKRATK